MASKMINIKSSCRTCLKDSANLVDLYKTVKIDENCLQLAELLMQCTAIQVTQDDKRPRNLCLECAEILQASYHFRIQALDCEEKFKEMLDSDVKEEPPELHLKEEDDDDQIFDSYDFETLFDTGLTKNETDDTIKSYDCNKCDKTYTQEKKFLKHLASHERLVLPCLYCNKLFKSQSSLDKHVSKHHRNDLHFNTDATNTEGYECSKCEMSFTQEKKFLKHLEAHERHQLPCSFCGKLYLSQKCLDKHVGKHHKADVCTTSENKADIETAIEVNNVVKMEIVDQPLQCSACDMKFCKPRSLAMHLKKHKDKMTKCFICDICGRMFLKKPLLKRHLLNHSESKPFKCKSCPKQYSRQDQYMQHIYTHKENKPYVCQQCKKGFAQLCSLKDHLRIHTGETPFLCSECGKGFTNSSNLRQHMMRHSGLKPYACNMCPKTFCTKGQLTSHMSTHTGEHPYKCKECGAAFTKPNSLKKHSFIHLGVRPFGCDTCSMRFTCKDHLKRHQRIHTGEKPYRCKYCDRSFTQSNDLVKHTRGHIGQNIYQCTICSARFRLLSELKLHYPIHFGKDKDGNEIQHTENTVEPSEVQGQALDKEMTLADVKPPKIKPPIMNKDLPFLKLMPSIDRESVLGQKSIQYDKDLPLLSIKPQEMTNNFIAMPEVKSQDLDNRITITINGCDKNGVVGDITINIGNEI